MFAFFNKVGLIAGHIMDKIIWKKTLLLVIFANELLNCNTFYINARQVTVEVTSF